MRLMGQPAERGRIARRGILGDMSDDNVHGGAGGQPEFCSSPGVTPTATIW